ncbi:hypothetical protein [Aulosira sp. FACHB-615]|uniref:hypothetical protein n=1 Tax=Aulosira sp. FACHB-615 TaxID=2692777 RepID=UPI001685AAB3|nr:hypothetical protein [Aulosira sp. FACHB-615]MBD2492614.1 hypothetical protein [Aulosira sp. FACHB-615]
MAINTSFSRPKLAQTLTENLALTGAIAEGSGKFLVDINVSVTQDDQKNGIQASPF